MTTTLREPVVLGQSRQMPNSVGPALAGWAFEATGL